MFETFKNLLVEELQLDESAITMEAELKGDLNINSIELYDLAMMCEDKFGVEIEDEEIPLAPNFTAPQTGDTSSLFAWLAVAVVTGTLFIIASTKMRRASNER